MDPEPSSAYTDSAVPSPRALGRASPALRNTRTPRSERNTPTRSVRRPAAGVTAAEGEIDNSSRRQSRRPADPKVRPTKRAPPRVQPVGATRKQARSRASRAPNTLTLSSQAPPLSPERVLLRKAQQVVEADAALLGKRPCIMDVILNAKAPVSEYSEDIVMEALERSEAAFPVKHDYAFADDDGVERYWADQAILWRGWDSDSDDEAQPSDLIRFQESAERSTASWPSDAEDDISSQSDAQSSYAYGQPTSPAGTATTLIPPRDRSHKADVASTALRTPNQYYCYPDIISVGCGS
ncbi:hypothetical protein DAEQUDRAFT_809778 [Daedalea quercina L-15889]|uniref:Uncharacterized protein n=1 Tax=Daedalea quercina L-15889 TaxID=1314783 RepID=A0A165S285_9APHY|nr:hypothetical protein DAEQUDRAFT_809778 [Daedalea quercina L-15889]